MDVRCEKCLTVYEFEDAQVGPQGVTVKCTQCGNLFRVTRGGSGPHAAPAPRELSVRLAASGEVYGLPDFQTVETWIAERRLGPDDQLSRDGQTWSRLDAIPEAQAVFRKLAPDPVPVELAATAPMAQPPVRGDASGPYVLGDAAVDSQDPAFAPTGPQPRVTPPALPSVVDELADLELPPPRRWPQLVALMLLFAAGAAGYLIYFKPELVRGGGTSRAQKAYADGRAQLLLDTDDGLRSAVAQLQLAHGADESDARTLAALAEAEATWAFYLREDAGALDAAGPAGESAARTLRKQAQGHLDDAKRHAADALARDPESAEANRAMADYLRVDGAPAAEAERYLKRALDKAPGDAETVYVAGALALREGRADEAKTKLTQALQLSGGTLARAAYLLAKIAAEAGDRGEVQRQVEAILKVSPQHERAKALLQTPSAPEVAVAADLGAAPPPESVDAAAPKRVEEPVSYEKLVQQGDRLSENGRSEAARKLYEKALQSNPSGVEALTGLAYCDLDRERYMSAVERFKQALGVTPDYGEALIGLAEVYKLRGDRAQATGYYRRYLKAQPNGPKAAMAQKNVKELESRAPERPPAEEDPPRDNSALPRLPPAEAAPPPP